MTAETSDPVAAISADLPPDAATDAMPADTWARLAAAIQVEAARSTHSGALSPDHVLLKPDPLLAPKKEKRAAIQQGIAPAYRFILAAAIAVVVAASLTLFILHHRSTPRGKPATAPASQPAPDTAPATVPLTAPATAPRVLG